MPESFHPPRPQPHLRQKFTPLPSPRGGGGSPKTDRARISRLALETVLTGGSIHPFSTSQGRKLQGRVLSIFCQRS